MRNRERISTPSLRALAGEQHDRVGTENVRRTNGEEPWNAYRSGLSIYEFQFATVLPESDEPLQDFKLERHRQGKTCVALDIMGGSGSALRDLKPDKGLLVTLQDFRDDWLRQRDASQLDVIAGDIYTQKVWQEINKWVQEHGTNQTFDLIMEHGIAALENFPDDPKLMSVLLDHLWTILSSDNGLLVMQLPVASKQYAPQWVARLNELTGYNTACYSEVDRIPGRGSSLPKIYPVLSLRRTTAAPQHLPAII